MNTRLQVEHPVTELVTGIDLVEQQLLIAADESVSFDPASVTSSGHALELRVYAEDPRRFLPGPGVITTWREPSGEGVRVDAGYAEGNTVTPAYDPLLAKLCVWDVDRAAALDRARSAVETFIIEGPKNNLPFFVELLDHPPSRRARTTPVWSTGCDPEAPRSDKRRTREESRVAEEVRAEMVANVWKIVVAPGDSVEDGDTLVILESMKMEIPVIAESSGQVTALHVSEGDVVQEGDVIAVIG